MTWNGNPGARARTGAKKGNGNYSDRFLSSPSRKVQLSRADHIASLANREQLIYRHPDGETEGRQPLEVPIADLNAAGHFPRPMLKIIRVKCLDCSGHQVGEIRKCTAVKCALWPYRMGANPFRRGAAYVGSFGSKKPGKSPRDSGADDGCSGDMASPLMEAAE